jgi:hypothetical protein
MAGSFFQQLTVTKRHISNRIIENKSWVGVFDAPKSKSTERKQTPRPSSVQHQRRPIRKVSVPLTNGSRPNQRVSVSHALETVVKVISLQNQMAGANTNSQNSLAALGRINRPIRSVQTLKWLCTRSLMAYVDRAWSLSSVDPTFLPGSFSSPSPPFQVAFPSLKYRTTFCFSGWLFTFIFGGVSRRCIFSPSTTHRYRRAWRCSI